MICIGYRGLEAIPKHAAVHQLPRFHKVSRSPEPAHPPARPRLVATCSTDAQLTAEWRSSPHRRRPVRCDEVRHAVSATEPVLSGRVLSFGCAHRCRTGGATCHCRPWRSVNHRQRLPQRTSDPAEHRTRPSGSRRAPATLCFDSRIGFDTGLMLVAAPSERRGCRIKGAEARGSEAFPVGRPSRADRTDTRNARCGHMEPSDRGISTLDLRSSSHSVLRSIALAILAEITLPYATRVPLRGWRDISSRRFISAM